MARAMPPLPYKLVAGELCLDFVNTVGGRIPAGHAVGGHDWADRIVGERLDTYAALVAWTEATGAADATQAARLEAHAQASTRRASRVLARARALREALYRIFKASIESWAPRDADVALLDREAAELRAATVLVWGDGRMERRWRGANELAYPLWPVVRSAEALLTGDALARVGQCPGDRCGWLFLDTSRGGRRRWCTMSDCGNVAKVRRFRHRATGKGRSPAGD